jgi:hypothetical protein
MHPQFHSPRPEIFLNVSPQFSYLKQCNNFTPLEPEKKELTWNKEACLFYILHDIKSAPLDGPHVPEQGNWLYHETCDMEQINNLIK